MKSIAIKGLMVSTVLLAATLASAVDLALGPLRLHPTFDGEDLMVIGPVKFHPHFEFAATYSDNVYIGPSYRTHQGVPASPSVGDFSFTMSPGLQAVYGDTDRNFISLDYTASIVEFAGVQGGSKTTPGARYDTSDQNTVNHFLTLGARYEFTKLIVDADHSFQKTEGADTQVGDSIERTLNYTTANAEYPISSKTSIGLGYKQEIYSYKEENLNDYSDFSGFLRFYYKMLPKTDLFGEVRFGYVDVNSSHPGGSGANSTADYDQISVGLRGDLTAKTVGTIKVGYEHRSFESSSVSSIDSVVAEVDLKTDFTERTSAELRLSHRVNPSIVQNGNNYQATRVDLMGHQKVWKNKISLVGGVAYEHDEYEKAFAGERRRDDYVEAKAGADYDITRNFLVGALYTYRRNVSTVGAVSFEQNTFTIRGLVRF